MKGTEKIIYSGLPVDVSIDFDEPKADDEFVVIQIYSQDFASAWSFFFASENDPNGIYGIANCIYGQPGEYQLDWQTEGLLPMSEIE